MFIRIKRKLQSNKKNNMIILFFFFLLTCLISVGYSSLEQNLMISGDANYFVNSNKLYDVLKRAAKIGTYAREYTEAHQDSFAGNGTEKIYHWYATSDEDGTAIQNMNNVIFANHCWQMIRTTDTGGVKMIYNGEVDNNQCLNTRGTHVGYSQLFNTPMSTTYYYGTDYIYDSTNNVFSLSGNVTTGTIQTGQYTCKSTLSTGTCSTIYLVDTPTSTSTNYPVFPLKSSSKYNQFGTLQYNRNDNSPANVGYMYNIVYPTIRTDNTFVIYHSATINTSYYYSDTIDYNNITSGQYTLTNPSLISTLANNSDLIGKYVLSKSGTTDIQARYIIAVEGTTYYYKDLIEGDLNTSLTIGDTYSESGGVYTLSGNVTNVPYITWYNTSDLSVYLGKYVCNGNNTSCTNLKHIYTGSNPSESSFYYCSVDKNTYSYAESVSYDGTTYTLTGDIKTFWDYYDSTNQEYLSTHHYTCLENGSSCTTVSYMNYLSYDMFYSQITGVENVAVALNNMLYANDVNTKNSNIKTAIEAWYAKYLSKYDSYIEDTIFCNNRTIGNLGTWNPDGGPVMEMHNHDLIFKGQSSNKDLSCDRDTDKFSTINTSAQLTYKVGLMSNPEMNLLRNNKVRVTGSSYWLFSPHSFKYGDARANVVGSSGVWGHEYVSVSQGVRPAISLIPGIEFVSGNGSMVDPFIIDAESSMVNPSVPSISGGTTKVYGASDTTLTCTTSSTYGNGTNLYYSFGYASSDGGTPGNWTAPTTTNTLTISSTEYVGQRWYSCRVYASDGISSTDFVASSTESDAEVTINNAAITFDATTNGGTLSGDSTLYVRSGNANVYTEIRGSTTGSIPTASKSGFIFNGWYTADTGGSKVLNDNGSFTGTEVSGYTNASSWAATSNQTLYAQFASAIDPPNAPTISGGTTKIFNYQATTLTCATTSTYPTGTSIYYEFGYSETSGGTVTWLGSPSTTATLSVAKDAYRGSRYYTCRVYANDGNSSSSAVAATATTTMSLVNARLYFNANNGTVSGTNPVYVSYGSTALYTTRTGTTTASIPNVSRSGYTFSGWYTAKSGGTQVITSAKAVKASVSSWTNSSKQWIRTATGDTNTANVLYAHWSRSISWTYYYDWGDSASCATAAYCHDPCEYHNYSYWGCSSSSSTPPSSASQTGGRYCWCGS